MNIRLCNHLKSRHHLLLEFIPLDDRIIQLNLWQVNQHSCDLWSFVFTHKLLNMLVNCVSDDLFFLSSVSCFFKLFGSEHVPNFNEIVLSVFLVSILRNWRIWGRDDWSGRRRTSRQSWDVLVDQGSLLLLLSIHKQRLVCLHLSELRLVHVLLRRRSHLLIIERAVSVQILLVWKLLAIKLLLVSNWILEGIPVKVSWLLRELTLLEKLWILSKVCLTSIELLVLPEVVAHWIQRMRFSLILIATHLKIKSRFQKKCEKLN